MIARPARLEEWTLALVGEIAASGISENDWYDLKGNLQGQAEHQRKAVAAFANTQGGFLVFGVTNDRQVLGLDNPELPRDFGNKLTHGLNPSAAFRFSAPMAVSANGAVWICEIPQSQRGPHAVLISDHWVFPRRTESGSNVTMNVEESRTAFVDLGRVRANVELFRSELYRICELAEKQGAAAGGSTEGFVGVRYNTARIEGVLPLIFSVLAENSWLVRHLDALRNAAQEADAWLSGVSPFVRLNEWQYVALRKKVAEDAVRVMNAAKNTLAVFEGMNK
jgi:Putative DNA-binding domain